MRMPSALAATSWLVCWLGASSGSGAPTQVLRYLALGDSYTIGEGIESAGRWPVQLAALLRRRGLGLGEPEIVARTGWTTAELSAGIDAASPRGPFALVSLLIGVNDQYRGGRPPDYPARLPALLPRAPAFSRGAPGPGRAPSRPARDGP